MRALLVQRVSSEMGQSPKIGVEEALREAILLACPQAQSLVFQSERAAVITALVRNC